jgi:hypothetical protein
MTEITGQSGNEVKRRPSFLRSPGRRIAAPGCVLVRETPPLGAQLLADFSRVPEPHARIDAIDLELEIFAASLPRHRRPARQYGTDRNR